MIKSFEIYNKHNSNRNYIQRKFQELGLICNKEDIYYVIQKSQWKDILGIIVLDILKDKIFVYLFMKMQTDDDDYILLNTYDRINKTNIDSSIETMDDYSKNPDNYKYLFAADDHGLL